MYVRWTTTDAVVDEDASTRERALDVPDESSGNCTCPDEICGRQDVLTMQEKEDDLHYAKHQKVAKRKINSHLKKAPDAPKRFKSAYIFFSAEKHKEIRAQMGDKGVTEQTSNISKLVSKAWKELLPDQRQKWEAMAVTDKARYDIEKTLYDGPWQVPRRRTPKDSRAPKRPMSSFLAFANSRRATVKQRFPTASNGDVSKTLAAMWREASDEVRQPFIDWERGKRQEYKLAISQWKRQEDERKHLVRYRREQKALRLAENVEVDNGDDSSLYENKNNAGNEDDDDGDGAAAFAQDQVISEHADLGGDPYQRDSLFYKPEPCEPRTNQRVAINASKYVSSEVHPRSEGLLYEDRRGAEEQHESIAAFYHPGFLDASGGAAETETARPHQTDITSYSGAYYFPPGNYGARGHSGCVIPSHYEAHLEPPFANLHASQGYGIDYTVSGYKSSIPADGWYDGWSDGVGRIRGEGDLNKVPWTIPPSRHTQGSFYCQR